MMDWVWWIGNCAIIVLCLILGRFIFDSVSRIRRRSADQLKIKRFVSVSTQTIDETIKERIEEEIKEKSVKKIEKPKIVLSHKIKMREENRPKIAKEPDLNANFSDEEKPNVKDLLKFFEKSGKESPKSQAVVRRNKLSNESRLRNPMNILHPDPVTMSLVSKYMNPQPTTNVVRRRRNPSNTDRVSTVEEILRQQRLSRSLSDYSVSEYVDEVNPSVEFEFRKLADNRRSTPSFTGSFTDEVEDELWRITGNRNSLILRQSLTKCVSTENITENGHSYITHYQSCIDLTRNSREMPPHLNRQESQSVSNLHEEIYFENKRFSQYSFPDM